MFQTNSLRRQKGKQKQEKRGKKIINNKVILITRKLNLQKVEKSHGITDRVLLQKLLLLQEGSFVSCLSQYLTMKNLSVARCKAYKDTFCCS